MCNLFLLHLREQQELPFKQVADRIGMSLSRYREDEKAGSFIASAGIELLSVLLRMKKKYLRHYCVQLQFFAYHNGIAAVKEERIQQLTLPRKKKFRRTSFQKKRKWKQQAESPESKTTREPAQPTT